VLEVRHSVTILAHDLSTPIAPGGLAGDLTVASARHPPWTSHPGASTGQIDPTLVIPYPHPCLATAPPPQNQTHGENRRGISPAAEPQSTSPSPSSFKRRQPPSLSLACGPTPRRRSPPSPPLVGLVGRLPVRLRACSRSAGPKSPPTQLARNPFSFSFPIPFSHFHIYIYMLIFYAPKIV
jgi:hypothetical protein